MLLQKSDIGKGVELAILRKPQTHTQTLGKFCVFDENDYCIFSGATLELAFYDNIISKSCIPPKSYHCKKVEHKRFGSCFVVLNVPNRSGIYGHIGNFHTDISGCILFGKGFKHLNSDNLKDVWFSVPTFNKLMDSLNDRFNLIIFQDQPCTLAQPKL